jgi:peptidase E
VTEAKPPASPPGAAPEPRRIVLLGGGFRPNGTGGWAVGPLLQYVLDLAGREHPRVCLINTATGDDPAYYTRAYAALNAVGARVSHLALFPMPSSVDPEALLLAQDVIFVGGGSVANLAAVWATHRIGPILAKAWESGVILTGSSAGAICWFESGTTDSFGFDLQPFANGLGLLAGSYCPHYDSEERRRPTFHRLIADGTLPPGWALDDGAALRFDGAVMTDVVRDRDGVFAYRVDRDGPAAVETSIEPRRLSEPTSVPGVGTA